MQPCPHNASSSTERSDGGDPYILSQHLFCQGASLPCTPSAGFSRQPATPGSSDSNYIIHMKSLAIPILCFSLLTTNTFAVSLTPPQVYAVKEDRSMASNVDTSETSTSTKILITTLSAGIIFSGLMFLLIGSTQLGNENYNQSDAKRSIGVGAGMTVLGTCGIIGTWAF